MNTLKTLSLALLTACGGGHRTINIEKEAQICAGIKATRTKVFEITSTGEEPTRFCTAVKNPPATCREIMRTTGVDVSYYFDLDNCQARRP